MAKTLLLIFLLLCRQLARISGTLSNPFRADGDINQVIPEYNDVKRIKAYHNMTPATRHDVPLLNQELPSCGVNPRVKWSATVGSSVYSTPVIFPSGPEGTKQIFLSTFYQYVEVLGFDGYKPWGFPLGFDGSSFQSSPILYDIDGDGTNDLALIDKNANIYWVRLGEYGQYLEDFHIQVPKLKVKKDWADGMDPAFLDSYVMTSMFDNRFEPKNTAQAVKPDVLLGVNKKESGEPVAQRKLHLGSQKREEVHHWTGRVLMNVETEEIEDVNQETPKEMEEESSAAQHKETQIDDEFARERNAWEAKREEENEQDLKDRENFEQDGKEHDLNEAYSPPHWDDPHGDPINPVDGGDPMEWTDDYNVQRYRHWERRSYFGDDYLFNGYGGWGINDTHFAFVDPHVLASATLADINNDGDMELIIPISYYFDKEEYRGLFHSLSFLSSN